MLKIQGSLASKLPNVGTSIFATMSKLAEKENALNLSQGFPDFNCPDKLIELVNKYMKAGYNQYAPMPGYLKLKEKIAQKVEDLYSYKYNPDKEITITAGATQAIFAAISTFIKEGDEVIIFEPAYDSYLPTINLNKGVPKYVKLSPVDYSVNWDEVKRLINFNTKLIILNSPHNPTGTVLTAQDMMKLEKIVDGRDIIILSDEVYEHITFDGYQHQSICCYPKLAERSLVISSFGKTYHTTGWKMGYILGPSILMAEFRKVYQFMMFTASTPLQYAYCDFMDYKDHYLNLPSFYEAKRNLFVEGLIDSKFDILPSTGTYFQCLGYKNISDENDVEFAKRLTKEYKIASIPISVFYHSHDDQHVLRFCFAKNDDTLKKATEILCKI